jgi:ElaA protein
MLITWVCTHFRDLAPEHVYNILQLRNEVFVVEQNCVFQDADNKDQAAWHCMGWNSNMLVAYSRILPAGVAYAEASIGRVVTSPSVRRTGVGHELMRQSITHLRDLIGEVPIRIGAQFYLKKFYETFGFVQSGDIYLEDGIEHIEMVRDPRSFHIRQKE